MTRTRSIGARSDWSHGDADANGEEDDAQSNGHKYPPSRTWSIYKDDGESSTGKPNPADDPDDPINKYVQDQLARINSNEGREFAEELNAQNDGADDEH